MFSPDKHKLAFECEGVKIYIPHNTMEYHMSRFVEATRQNMYAASGATEDVIRQHLDTIIELCNQTADLKTIKTDIAGIANALKMRMKYPIDAHVGVRLGCVLSFAELWEGGRKIYEDPDKCETFWLEKKTKLALQIPDLYSFFFSLGISSSTAYTNLLDTLSDSDYFNKRRMEILAMLPERFAQLAS